VKDTDSLRVHTQRPRLTQKIDLPGQQDRLRQLILYVAQKCATAERMGLVKLNKILWRSDFEAFAIRQKPVTGRAYQRLDLGPAPREMPPLLREMNRDGLIRFEETDFGEGIIEKKPIAQASPNLSHFTEEDLAFVDAAITYYWNKSGRETSDDSHGIAWKSRENGEPIFYELALISENDLPTERVIKVARVLDQKLHRAYRSR
jgi:hypothetical protein